MSDLPSMERCPRNKRGRHELLCIVPEDSDHDMTLWCSTCGAVRRLPVSGPVVAAGSKDGLTAAEIDAMWADA